VHAYLVIARVSVQEAHNFVAGGPIHQAVNVREGVDVLQTCAVDVSVVDAHPPVTVGLGDHDDVGQPCRVSGLPYESGRQELAGFLLRRESLFVAQVPLLLGDRADFLEY